MTVRAFGWSASGPPRGLSDDAKDRPSETSSTLDGPIWSTGRGSGKGVGSLGVAIGSLLAMVTCPLAGAISDRVGRVIVYRVGAVFLLLYAFPAWWLMSLGTDWLAVAAIAVGISVGIQTMLGPQCALMPEMFGSRHRYLGVAVSREFSAVLAGGIAGVLGAELLNLYGNSWVPLAAYMAILAAITAFTTFFVPETRGRDLLKVEDAAQDPQLGLAVRRTPSSLNGGSRGTRTPDPLLVRQVL